MLKYFRTKKWYRKYVCYSSVEIHKLVSNGFMWQNSWNRCIYFSIFQIGTSLNSLNIEAINSKWRWCWQVESDILFLIYNLLHISYINYINSCLTLLIRFWKSIHNRIISLIFSFKINTFLNLQHKRYVWWCILFYKTIEEQVI